MVSFRCRNVCHKRRAIVRFVRRPRAAVVRNELVNERIWTSRVIWWVRKIQDVFIGTIRKPFYISEIWFAKLLSEAIVEIFAPRMIICELHAQALDGAGRLFCFVTEEVVHFVIPSLHLRGHSTTKRSLVVSLPLQRSFRNASKRLRRSSGVAGDPPWSSAFLMSSWATLIFSRPDSAS